MNRYAFLLALFIAFTAQEAMAKNRLTDPVKIARECKSDIERLCKEQRPGRQRVVTCLRDKAADLSPACSAALKSTR